MLGGGYQQNADVPVAETPDAAVASTEAATASDAAPDKSEKDVEEKDAAAMGSEGDPSAPSDAVSQTGAPDAANSGNNEESNTKDKSSTKKAVDEMKPSTEKAVDEEKEKTAKQQLGHSKRPRGAHPVWVAESQRFELQQGGWVPTAWIGDDPPPQQEILEYGDEGVLKPLPVDIDVATKRDKHGNLMYGAVIDEETDAEGWVYATKFENIDKPREGGRSRHRLTDKCRRRLWYLGNVLPPEEGEVVERSWLKMTMSKVSGRIDDAKKKMPPIAAPKELVKRMREVILEPDEDFSIDDIMETGWG